MLGLIIQLLLIKALIAITFSKTNTKNEIKIYFYSKLVLKQYEFNENY